MSELSLWLNVAPFASLRLGALLHVLARHVAEARIRRRQARALASIDEATLKDIGYRGDLIAPGRRAAGGAADA